jgi:hypothetical protein
MGVTYDTGALIAADRGKRRMRLVTALTGSDATCHGRPSSRICCSPWIDRHVLHRALLLWGLGGVGQLVPVSTTSSQFASSVFTWR